MNPPITELETPKSSAPRKRRSLATIERRIRELASRRQYTRLRVRLANLFAEAHRTLRLKRDAPQAQQAYQSWCKQTFGLDAGPAQELRQIGEAFDPSQVRRLSLNYAKLGAICQAPPHLHQTLLKLCSKKPLDDIRLAVEEAKDFSADELEQAQAAVQQAFQEAAKLRWDAAERRQEQAGILQTLQQADQLVSAQRAAAQAGQPGPQDTGGQGAATMEPMGIAGRRRREPTERDRAVVLCDEQGEIGDDSTRRPPIEIGAPDPRTEDGLSLFAGHHERRRVPREQPVAPEQGLVPATRPELHSPSQVLLEVPYPRFDDQPTELERAGGQIIVAMDEAESLAARLCDMADDDEAEDAVVAPLLALELVRSMDRFWDARQEVFDFLAPSREQAKEQLEQLLTEHEGTTAGDWLPLSLPPRPRRPPRFQIIATESASQQQAPLAYVPRPPMAYVLFDVVDPLNDPTPTPMERLTWRLLAVLDSANQAMTRLLELGEQDGDMGLLLLHQLYGCLYGFGFRFFRLTNIYNPGAELGLEEEQAMQAQDAQRVQLIDRSEQRIVLLGENSMEAARLCKLGLTDDWRQLALSLFTPQIVIALGNQGFGKSHLAALIAEGSAMNIPGLSRTGTEPSRVVLFSADWELGQTHHGLLTGFYPNGDPDHHQYLMQHYYADTSNVAFRRGVLLCLPGMKAHYEALYPDLIERGLVVREVRFHPTELAGFGTSVIVTGGGTAGTKSRSQAQAWFEAQIADHGPDLDLVQLSKDVEAAKIDYRAREFLMKQLGLLSDLTSQDEHLWHNLRDTFPVFVILENRYKSRDMILPIQVAMMNAMSGVLGEQDPHRWFILDELTKYLVNDGVGIFLDGVAAAVRHRPLSLYVAGQQASNMPQGLLGLATVYAMFFMGSPAQWRKALDHIGALHGVSYHDEVRTLQAGQALMGAVRASDRAFVERLRRVTLRPTCVSPGGETLTFY